MELWDVYDSNGNKTGRTKNRNELPEKGEYRLISSLWIINKEGKALIQKRSLTKKVNPGQWNITGGSVVSGETSEEACVREVFEEIGLSVNQSDLRLLTRKIANSGEYGLLKGSIFDDYIITVKDFDISNTVIQPDEVSELKWATLEEIKEIYNTGELMFNDIDDELAKVADYIKEETKWVN